MTKWNLYSTYLYCNLLGVPFEAGAGATLKVSVLLLLPFERQVWQLGTPRTNSGGERQRVVRTRLLGLQMRFSVCHTQCHQRCISFGANELSDCLSLSLQSFQPFSDLFYMLSLLPLTKRGIRSADIENCKYR